MGINMAISTSKRIRVFSKTNFKCFYCGEQLCASDPQNLCIDHLTPKSRGGSNDESNLVGSCRGCNSRKASRTLEEYRLVRWVNDLIPYADLSLQQCIAITESRQLATKSHYFEHKFYFEMLGNSSDQEGL